MNNNFNVNNWSSQQVTDWLSGLCDDSLWLNRDYIINNNLKGDKLLLMTADELKHLGAIKVDLQEKILEAIETFRYYSFCPGDTLQIYMHKLSNLAGSLHSQLSSQTGCVNFPPNSQSKELHSKFVSLETLSLVSAIVQQVYQITDLLVHHPFSKYHVYRSMKSFLLVFSIELTSTAQRDEFVERPNDILKESSRALADYCDRTVYGTKDPLLIQPFQFVKVRISKDPKANEIGLIVRSQSNTNGTKHLIEKIAPFSPAEKTNQLNEGDEIISFNQCIIGWSQRKVEELVQRAINSDRVNLIVKKRPIE